ncbi:MAG: lipoate--protein ligase family protein [Candidatus Micrarchaeia archaeon]
MSMWRVVRLSKNNAAMNMAIDEAVSNAVAEGHADPTIRFYMWEPSAVSIGYFQSIIDEVDVEFCKKNRIDYVRRRTGGGAVYHDSSGEITYSVIAPQYMFPSGIIESYKVICGWIINGLREIGINAEFVPINDVVVGGKKISGNAQTRRNGVLLQHGTILYDSDFDTMFRCLRISDEKIRDKMIKNVHERVTNIRSLADVDIKRLYDSLLKGFCDGKEFYFGELSTDEFIDANKLAMTKYCSDDWNFWR